METVSDSPRLGRFPGRDYEMLAVATGVVTLALLLDVRPDQSVAFRGWPSYPLPETCASRMWFGTSCPGCGLTRGLIHLAHADWAAAARVHRLSGLLAFAVLLQFPYRALCLRLGRPPLGRLVPKLFGHLLIAALLLNWIVRLLEAPAASP